MGAAAVVNSHCLCSRIHLSLCVSPCQPSLGTLVDFEVTSQDGFIYQPELSLPHTFWGTSQVFKDNHEVPLCHRVPVAIFNVSL